MPATREARAEQTAPRAQRVGVVGPDGVQLRGARLDVDSAPTGGLRASRRNVVAALYTRGQERVAAGEASLIRASHVAAAAMLIRDWDEVGGGIAPPPLDLLRSEGRGGGNGADGAILRLSGQIQARERLIGAIDFTGSQAGILHSVVLTGISVQVCAIALAVDRKQLVGYLAAALDRLVEYYGSRGINFATKDTARE